MDADVQKCAEVGGLGRVKELGYVKYVVGNLEADCFDSVECFAWKLLQFGPFSATQTLEMQPLIADASVDERHQQMR